MATEREETIEVMVKEGRGTLTPRFLAFLLFLFLFRSLPSSLHGKSTSTNPGQAPVPPQEATDERFPHSWKSKGGDAGEDVYSEQDVLGDQNIYGSLYSGQHYSHRWCRKRSDECENRRCKIT